MPARSATAGGLHTHRDDKLLLRAGRCALDVFDLPPWKLRACLTLLCVCIDATENMYTLCWSQNEKFTFCMKGNRLRAWCLQRVIDLVAGTKHFASTSSSRDKFVSLLEIERCCQQALRTVRLCFCPTTARRTAALLSLESVPARTALQRQHLQHGMRCIAQLCIYTFIHEFHGCEVLDPTTACAHAAKKRFLPSTPSLQNTCTPRATTTRGPPRSWAI